MNLEAPYIGIDFGTSNSKMAWYNPKTRQAEIIMNAEGETETPSVVYFGKGETLVGSPALEMLDYEEERERVIISVKRELVSTPLLAIPGQSIKPVAVASQILRKLKHDIEERHFHQQVTRVVITYPASFGPLERDKIRDAAQLAGFTEVEMLEEPVAAAMAYTRMGLQVGKFVLVYDLGGGTFDLAMLVNEEDSSFRLALDPQGIKRCGGDDFDEKLYNHCDKIARETLRRSISQAGKRDLKFLQLCRLRKENLSMTERRLFKSYLEPGPVLFQFELDRTTLENLIRPLVEETVRKTKMLLEQANAEGKTVDTMVLIGGSSRIPLVKRLLEQSLPLKPLQWQYQDVAVAFGAAYHAYSKWSIVESKEPVLSPKRRKPLLPPTPEPKVRARSVSSQAADKLGNFILTKTLTGHSSAVTSVAVSPDGKTLASGSHDKTIKLWDLHNGRLLRTLNGHAESISAIAISPDGKTLASGSHDKTVKLWDLHSGHLLRTLKCSVSVSSVAISPDGKTLVSGSGYKIRLWDLPGGKRRSTLAAHKSLVNSIAFSSDGQNFASASSDATIKLWNMRTNKVFRTFTGSTTGLRSIAISPDGRIFASNTRGKTIKVWNLRTKQLLNPLRGHSSVVLSLAIRPDGQLLAGGCEDTTVRLWNPGTGQLLYTLKGHSNSVSSVVFSSDGQTLISGGIDRTIRIWKKA